MRASRREVNIFNMSLLDILCGALGAFCFLTLTLFPYYGKKEGEAGARIAEAKNILQAAKNKLMELEHATRENPDAQAAKQAQEKVRQLQAELEAGAKLDSELRDVKEKLAEAKQDSAGPAQRQADAQVAAMERQIANLKNLLAQPEPKEDGLVLNGASYLVMIIITDSPGPKVKIAGQPYGRIGTFSGSNDNMFFWLAGDAAPGAYQFRFASQPPALSPRMGVRAFACGRGGCSFVRPSELIPGASAPIRPLRVDLDGNGFPRISL